jgi:hypothetical protein
MLQRRIYMCNKLFILDKDVKLCMGILHGLAVTHDNHPGPDCGIHRASKLLPWKVLSCLIYQAEGFFAETVQWYYYTNRYLVLGRKARLAARLPA